MHLTKISLFIIIVIFLLLYIGLFAKTVEGFSISDVVDDIKGVTNSVKDVKKTIEETVIKGIDEAKNSIKEVKKVAQDAEKLGKKLEKEVSSLPGKFKKLGNGIKNILNDAIVNPFKTLFYGIGDIFKAVWDILKEIGDKIVNLYHCVVFYTTDTIYDVFVKICKQILPTFITNIIGTIYDYTLGFIIRRILSLFGYYEERDKCYGFDINGPLNDINGVFKKISKAFIQGFGEIDLKQLNVF